MNVIVSDAMTPDERMTPALPNSDDINLQRLQSVIRETNASWITLLSLSPQNATQIAQRTLGWLISERTQQVVHVDLRDIPDVQLAPVLIAQRLAKVDVDAIVGPSYRERASRGHLVWLVIDYIRHLENVYALLPPLVRTNPFVRVIVCSPQPFGLDDEVIIDLDHAQEAGDCTEPAGEGRAEPTYPAILEADLAVRFASLDYRQQRGLVAVAVALPPLRESDIHGLCELSAEDVDVLAQGGVVSLIPAPQGRGVRLGMSHDIRSAVRRLASPADVNCARARYLEYVTKCIQDCMPDRQLVDTPEVDFARLEPLAAHIRHVLDTLLRERRFLEAANLISRLDWFWITRTHNKEGVYWLQRLLAELGDESGDEIAEIQLQIERAAGRIQLYNGDLLASVEYLARALRQSWRRNQPYVAARVLSELGQTLTQARHFQLAIRCHQQVLRVANETQNEELGSRARTQIGACLLFAGEPDRAERHLKHAVALARAHSTDPMLLARPLHYLGYLYSLTDRPDLGRLVLNESIGLQLSINTDGALWSRQMLARLELTAYNLAPAAEQLAMLLPRRMIRNDREFIRRALLDVAWLMFLQRDPKSSARFLGAGSADQLRHSPQLHHTRTFLQLYDCVRFQLGPEQFDRAYAAGAALPFEDAAIQATQSVVDSLLATGNPVRVRSSVRKTLLSPREIQVLRLMSEGKTDREIGESLGITVMTASTHVKKVLRKLQVTSRTAAVVAATQFGVLSPSSSRS